MTITAANLAGLLGNLFSIILFVPGALAVWRNRADAHSLRGSSVWQQGFIIANATTWAAYAWLTGAYWVAAPGLVNVPLAVFTAALILRARRVADSLTPC